MIAYLKLLALRWRRSTLGLEVLAGAVGAPLFFTGAVFVLYTWGPYAVTSAEDVKHAYAGLFAGVIMLSVLSSALSLTYLVVRSINVEKIQNRVTLLRTSGLDGTQAALSYLVISVVSSVLLVPMSLTGAQLLSLTIGTPPVTWTLLILTIATVLALSPFAIAGRLFFEQPVAFAISVGASLFGAAYIVGLSEAGPINNPLPIYAKVGAVWIIGTAALLLTISTYGRKRRTGWA